MSEDREIVKAVFVVLSKLRECRQGGGTPGRESLADLEKSLGVLAGLCEDEERADVVDWARDIEATREEIESFSSEIGKRIRNISSSLEPDVIDLMLRRLPEGKREEIREKLAEILDGGTELDLVGRQEPGNRRPLSGLEEKLKMLEGDEPTAGLERFFEENETN
jgi:hypothetical protein